MERHLLVMRRSTPRLRSVYQKNVTSHIEELYLSWIHFFQKHVIYDVRSFIIAWKPRDCFSIWFKRSEHQCSFLYNIINLQLHSFLFSLIYTLWSNELCSWNNRLKVRSHQTRINRATLSLLASFSLEIHYTTDANSRHGRGFCQAAPVSLQNVWSSYVWTISCVKGQKTGFIVIK